MTEYTRLLPQPTPDTQPYWDGLKAGTLRLQRCAGCGKVRHYPRPVCDACLNSFEDQVDYPCRERRAITEALGGAA